VSPPMGAPWEGTTCTMRGRYSSPNITKFGNTYPKRNACMYSCPVFKVVAGVFGGKSNMGGIGAIWTYAIEGEENAAPLIYTCLMYGRCVERGPMRIDIPRIIRELRKRIVRREYLGPIS